jgi:hypothetical protein
MEERRVKRGGRVGARADPGGQKKITVALPNSMSDPPVLFKVKIFISSASSMVKHSTSGIGKIKFSQNLGSGASFEKI